MGNLESRHGLFGNAEGERHTRASGRGDDAHTLLRSQDDQRLFRMLGVDAVPAFGNGEARPARESAGVRKNQTSDLLPFEDATLQTVFMRVAKGNRTTGI